MRLLIESTDKIVELGGTPVRLWKGTTEGGRPVDVYVAVIGSADMDAQQELGEELIGVPAPLVREVAP